MPTLLPPSSTVLVTGGTGFTGRELLRRLVEEGHQVRAFIRPSSQLEGLESLNIEWITGDLGLESDINPAVEGVNYIFHMATLYRDGSATEADHQRVHVDSTQLLAKAAKQQPNFQRFVHVSTIGVHGHVENPPADENAPFVPGDAYQRSKLEAETWIRDFAETEGLPFCILRPAGIYGPGDRRLLKLFRLARRPFFFIVGHGKCLYHLIHVEDLAELFLRAAVRPEADSETMICGNPEAIPLEEMVKVINETQAKPARVIRLPAAPIFALARLVELLCQPLKIKPPIYPRRVAFFTKDRSFDTRKIQRLLEWQPKYSNEDGLRLTAKAYEEAGWLR